MKSIPRLLYVLPVFGLLFGALDAEAQSFRVQCPISTPFHPDGSNIKCQQIAGGDGYATMGDGSTTYLFGFGPLSGLPDIYNGLPGTEVNSTFNTSFGPVTGTPSSLVGMPDGNFSFKGAIGLTEDYGVDPWAAGLVYLQGATVRTATGIYSATSDGTSGANTPTGTSTFFDGGVSWAYQGTLLDGHVDARPIMDVGVMNANQPAPLIAIDEDDELFLTLTNVGMIMRPDLFEQHTVHFHGYPNASAFYDGVPDASVAINIGASFTYYYLAPDAGTYFWHCHITPPEHLQMGMVGQLYVRPRQDRVTAGTSLYTSLAAQQTDLRTACRRAGDGVLPNVTTNTDILCSNPLPAINTGVNQVAGRKYVYNDGDGSTGYDTEYTLQIHGFDPNFHFVGMTFNPEAFAEMKDKFFLLSGRSYPDTVQPGPMATQSSDGRVHYSQPMASVINIPAGGRALLRIADLDVTEYQTLATLGIPMKEVGFNAKLLRDQNGNNLEFYTNSITLGGGESLDVILDASDAGCGAVGCAAVFYPSGSVFYLFTPNLDHLSNDQEHFGGLMTEVHIN